jgi:hypothetical protein
MRTRLLLRPAAFCAQGWHGTAHTSGPGKKSPPRVQAIAGSKRDPIRHYQDQPPSAVRQYKREKNLTHLIPAADETEITPAPEDD